MVLAEDIRKVILKLARQRGKVKAFYLSDVARQISQKNWRILLDQVRLVAESLAKEGKIEAHRKGKEIEILKMNG